MTYDHPDARVIVLKKCHIVVSQPTWLSHKIPLKMSWFKDGLQTTNNLKFPVWSTKNEAITVDDTIKDTEAIHKGCIEMSGEGHAGPLIRSSTP